MLCEGCVITGDIHNYQLYTDDGKANNNIREIKNKIKNMKNFHGESLVIDLINPCRPQEKENEIINSSRVACFQFFKCKNYSSLNYFYLELKLTSSKKYYRYVSKKELLELFDKICLRRELPDLSNWKLSFEFNSESNVGEVKDKAEELKCTNVVQSWLLDELSKEDYPLYFDSLKYLAERARSNEIGWHETYLEELEKKNLGEEILQVFKNTVNPYALYSIGYKYLYGINCYPNYKMAYRYDNL